MSFIKKKLLGIHKVKLIKKFESFFIYTDLDRKHQIKIIFRNTYFYK